MTAQYFSRFALCFFLAISSTLIAQQSQQLPAEISIDSAWKAWEINNLRECEQQFLLALSKDAKNVRARVGLSFLYDMQRRTKESWQIFRNIQYDEKNPYPYFFAEWVSPKISQGRADKTSGVTETLESFAKKGDEHGILSAMAYEVLGQWAQRTNNPKKALEYYNAIGAIVDWTIAGPFENISAAGYNAVYPPEIEYDTTANYPGKNNVPVRWFTPPVIRLDKWVDMQSFFPQRQAFFYANTFVFSPKKQFAQIRVGTSGAMKTLLNDIVILRDSNEMNNDFDTYIAETELQQGWNRLTVKVGYSELDRCNFLARITTAAGKQIPGLIISRFNKSYPAKIQPASIKILENFAEAFFREKIRTKPNHLENYLLLANCYLRNDKAIEAELCLRDALKLSPNCSIIYHMLLNAYGRGRKNDEVSTTYEKIAALSANLIDGQLYKFNQYLRNEDFDAAESILNRLDSIMPERDETIGLRLDFFSKKKMFDKVIELGREAYKRSPTTWRFVSLMAAIDYQTTRSYDGSIEIYKKYLQTEYNENGLTNLAEAYLKASKKKEWENTYSELLRFSPSSPGYYYQMAVVFNEQQEYSRATNQIEQALEFCPSCGDYWSKLGGIQRSAKNVERAKSAYRQALTYTPTDYDSRAALRELEGKKSIFSVFGELKKDSIIAAAPTANDYPDANSIIVLDKTHRVFYKEGASESSYEQIIRLFTDRGIDAFKEYSIGYNSTSQNLIVEKAVVIKPDGTEIRADVNKNYFVFKSLEKNDFIYISWKIRDYYSGKLSNHFSDEVNFNRFMPIVHAEYALMIPKGIQFSAALRNGAPKSVEHDTPDGMMYKWQIDNEPAVVYEADMPNLDEVGKMLRISTIPDWKFFVDWYLELAQTKAQSSYEIQEKTKEILEGNYSLSNEEKIQRIYTYITENIRYSSVPFRQSGLIPQKARDVLVNRIGDCKDVSTLGIAMLREAGVVGHYVLVNSGNEENLGEIPPALEFNHCIVAVEQQGEDKPLFLDFTANNFPLGSMPKIDRAAFSLIIKPGISNPTILPRTQPISVPSLYANTTVVIHADNSAVITEQFTFSGSAVVSLRSQYRNKPQKERERMMIQSLSSEYPGVKLLQLAMPPLDALNQKESYICVYETPNFVSEAGSYRLLKIPWQSPIQPSTAFSYEQRAFPIKYIGNVDYIKEELTIVAPSNFTLVEMPKEKQLESPVSSYSVEYSQSGTKIQAKRMYSFTETLASTDRYQQFRQFHSAVVKEDQRVLLFRTEE